MNLYFFHRLLIGSAIVASLALLAYQIWSYSVSGRGVALVIAVAAAVAATGFSLYLRWFIRRSRKS